MRFICDMPVSLSVSQWLTGRNHDSVHVKDLGMKKAVDREIVEKAEKEKRVVITCDLDFGDIMAASGETAPSVIIFRLSNSTASNMISRLAAVIDESASSLDRGAIIIIEDTRHRIRTLPV